MKKYNQKEFEKRYDKFKNNNLPTLFWDKKDKLMNMFILIKEKKENI